MQNIIKKHNLTTEETVVSIYTARILTNLSFKYLSWKYNLFDREYIELLGFETPYNKDCYNANFGKNIKFCNKKFSGDIKDRSGKKVIINYAKDIANHQIKTYNQAINKKLLMLQSYLGLNDVDILILEFLIIASLNDKLADFIDELRVLTTKKFAKILAYGLNTKKILLSKDSVKLLHYLAREF